MDSFDNWTTQARKGIIELCILNAISSRKRYGYDLVKTLLDIPGLGVSEGTIYPLLSRLRIQGFVRTHLEESSEGPARKFYSLTAAGRKQMAAMNTYYTSLTKAVNSLKRER